MLLQTNSYIVPKERRVEHQRLLRRFRQTLARLGCEHFEVYEQVGTNWTTGENTGRYVQIMRFRDRRHQLTVQSAERADAGAQAVIAEFCELINFPYQQQQGLFAVGFYQSALPVSLRREATRAEVEASGDAKKPATAMADRRNKVSSRRPVRTEVAEAADTEPAVEEEVDAEESEELGESGADSGGESHQPEAETEVEEQAEVDESAEYAEEAEAEEPDETEALNEEEAEETGEFAAAGEVEAEESEEVAAEGEAETEVAESHDFAAVGEAEADESLELAGSVEAEAEQSAEAAAEGEVEADELHEPATMRDVEAEESAELAPPVEAEAEPEQSAAAGEVEVAEELYEPTAVGEAEAEESYEELMMAGEVGAAESHEPVATGEVESEESHEPAAPGEAEFWEPGKSEAIAGFAAAHSNESAARAEGEVEESDETVAMAEFAAGEADDSAAIADGEIEDTDVTWAHGEGQAEVEESNESTAIAGFAVQELVGPPSDGEVAVTHADASPAVDHGVEEAGKAPAVTPFAMIASDESTATAGADVEEPHEWAAMQLTPDQSHDVEVEGEASDEFPVQFHEEAEFAELHEAAPLAQPGVEESGRSEGDGNPIVAESNKVPAHLQAEAEFGDHGEQAAESEFGLDELERLAQDANEFPVHADAGMDDSVTPVGEAVVKKPEALEGEEPIHHFGQSESASLLADSGIGEANDVSETGLEAATPGPHEDSAPEAEVLQLGVLDRESSDHHNVGIVEDHEFVEEWEELAEPELAEVENAEAEPAPTEAVVDAAEADYADPVEIVPESKIAAAFSVVPVAVEEGALPESNATNVVKADQGPFEHPSAEFAHENTPAEPEAHVAHAVTGAAVDDEESVPATVAEVEAVEDKLYWDDADDESELVPLALDTPDPEAASSAQIATAEIGGVDASHATSGHALLDARPVESGSGTHAGHVAVAETAAIGAGVEGLEWAENASADEGNWSGHELVGGTHLSAEDGDIEIIFEQLPGTAEDVPDETGSAGETEPADGGKSGFDALLSSKQLLHDIDSDDAAEAGATHTAELRSDIGGDAPANEAQHARRGRS